MNNLEMLIQSIDAHYHSSTKIFCYNLSCSLLNIYKGRCNLFVTNEYTNVKEEIIIKHDRAIMEGNLKVNNHFFETLPLQLSNKSDKPSKIEITIEDKLNVNSDGVLFIDKQQISKILNFQFYIPIL
tara:strand:- start:171 stop:551 length:381 start_codon:yes stop_codon:yes gene_type:complete